MTERERLIAWLVRLVADGLMREEEAGEMLRAYDAGEIDVDALFLPVLPEPKSVQDDAERAGALLERMFGALLGGLLATRRGPRWAVVAADVRYPAALQTWWAERSATHAHALATGSLNPAQWMSAVDDDLRTYMTMQHMGGWGGGVGDPAALERAVRRQRAFLSRFADETALRQQQGQPFSEAYLANRTEMYGGAGRAHYYESQIEAHVQAGDLGLFRVRYIAMDDGGTCQPCHDAMGLYEPGDPNMPLPGQVCLGRNKCRCTLEYVLARPGNR